MEFRSKHSKTSTEILKNNGFLYYGLIFPISTCSFPHFSMRYPHFYYNVFPKMNINTSTHIAGIESKKCKGNEVKVANIRYLQSPCLVKIDYISHIYERYLNRLASSD